MKHGAKGVGGRVIGHVGKWGFGSLHG
jgi:hypothetical protein